MKLYFAVANYNHTHGWDVTLLPRNAPHALRHTHKPTINGQQCFPLEALYSLLLILSKNGNAIKLLQSIFSVTFRL